MSDFFFDHPFVTVCLLIGVAVSFGIYLGTKSSKETERLVAQCLADGRKEYECRAMFKKSTPTIIYMSR